MKKIINNFRNNNLPESVLLLGVLALSVGFFITPRRGHTFFLWFTKNEILDILSYFKIIGVFVAVLGALLIFKKYFEKFNLEVVETQKNKVEGQTKNNLADTGDDISVFNPRSEEHTSELQSR